MGAMCAICKKDVVHPERDYALCLDCLIKLLHDQGYLQLPLSVLKPWASIKYHNETHTDQPAGGIS